MVRTGALKPTRVGVLDLSIVLVSTVVLARSKPVLDVQLYVEYVPAVMVPDWWLI